MFYLNLCQLFCLLKIHGKREAGTPANAIEALLMPHAILTRTFSTRPYRTRTCHLNSHVRMLPFIRLDLFIFAAKFHLNK